MRLDAEVMFDVIPKFLRDGWQVVWPSVPLVILSVLISIRMYTLLETAPTESF